MPREADPLTPAELAFRALLADPQALHEWAAEARAAWLKTPQGRDALARVMRWHKTRPTLKENS